MNPTPADHAAALVTWLAGRRAAEVARDLPAAAAALAPHADALADAADSADEAVRGAGLAALFGGLVEPLNDAFTPAGRALYSWAFGRIVWRACARRPELAQALAAAGIGDAEALVARHARVRAATGPAPGDPARVVVLSRVTLGADILLTSVALQRLHRRWPQAELVLLGDGKLGGLLGGLPRVRVRPLAYGRRGPLGERLASWLALLAALREESPDLVVAPDSRLDQLGLLPVTADPARYWLWENLRPEGAPACSLAGRLDAWLAQRLGQPAEPPCLPQVALDAGASAVAGRLRAAFGAEPLCAVKLDHGGNPAKALPRAAEVHLLTTLRERGWRILLDRGFGADELANSDALCAALGWTPLDLDDSGKGLGRPVDGLAAGALAEAPVIRFHGSIAGWAAAAAACRLAFSYDSVGHHLAAALGVPVVVAFTGHADDDFPIAWQPRGPARIAVVAIPTARKAEPEQWARVAAEIPCAWSM